LTHENQDFNIKKLNFPFHKLFPVYIDNQRN